MLWQTDEDEDEDEDENEDEDEEEDEDEDEDEDEEMPEASEGVPNEVTREMLVQFYAKHDPTKVDKVAWPSS